MNGKKSQIKEFGQYINGKRPDLIREALGSLALRFAENFDERYLREPNEIYNDKV